MHVPDLTDVLKHDCVFLSPHLDDIALSCPGRVLEETSSGRTVLIATLFSHAGQADAGRFKRDAYPNRQAEDKRAAEVLGADTLHATMLDAPFRAEIYQRFSGIMFKRDANHASTMMQAADYVSKLLERAQPETLFVPLGVGWHIDHRLTREAALVGASNYKWRKSGATETQRITDELKYQSDRILPKIVFYEDRPYSFVQESVRLRLAELGYSADAHDLPLADTDELRESLIESFMSAHYVKHALTPDEKDTCLRNLNSHVTRGSVQPVQQAQSDVHLFDRVTLATARKAVAAHASQLAGLYGDIDGWQRMTQEYSRRLGFDSDYVERYWTLP